MPIAYEDENEDYAEKPLDPSRRPRRNGSHDRRERRRPELLRANSMSTLHTVNKSPFERDRWRPAFGHASAGDAVLMIEDGVFGARKGGAFARTIAESRAAVCDLRARARSRGARHEAEDLVEGVKVVDYDGFVDLAATHARVCAWL